MEDGCQVAGRYGTVHVPYKSRSQTRRYMRYKSKYLYRGGSRYSALLDSARRYIMLPGDAHAGDVGYQRPVLRIVAQIQELNESPCATFWRASGSQPVAAVLQHNRKIGQEHWIHHRNPQKSAERSNICRIRSVTVPGRHGLPVTRRILAPGNLACAARRLR